MDFEENLICLQSKYFSEKQKTKTISASVYHHGMILGLRKQAEMKSPGFAA